MEPRLDALRESRRSPHVALHQYNTLRSRHPSVLVCVFEGADDVAFFDTVIRRIRDDCFYYPLVVNGKDQVLGLRVLLAKSAVQDNKRVRFFIDKDYDDHKGHPGGEDLYCTPTYSIENLMVTEEILEGLLVGEYRCTGADGVVDCGAIKARFLSLRERFNIQMRDANLLIYHARVAKVAIKNIEENLNKYVEITTDDVRSLSDRNGLCSLVVLARPVDWAVVDADNLLFAALDPNNDWRGKYLFRFFRKFLTLLKDDRTSERPHLFSAPAKVRFDPNSDVVRAIAALCKIPECLRGFVTKMPASA